MGEDRRSAYVDGADIVSYDWYASPIRTTPAGLGAGRCTAGVRDLTDRSKPVWPFIETSDVFADSSHRPSPAEVTAEVWNAIVGGARGIQYFNHNFKAGSESQHVLIDDRYAAVARSVRETNRRIEELAPVLNAPWAEGLARATGGR